MKIQLNYLQLHLKINIPIGARAQKSKNATCLWHLPMYFKTWRCSAVLSEAIFHPDEYSVIYWLTVGCTMLVLVLENTDIGKFMNYLLSLRNVALDTTGAS